MSTGSPKWREVVIHSLSKSTQLRSIAPLLPNNNNNNASTYTERANRRVAIVLESLDKLSRRYTPQLQPQPLFTRVICAKYLFISEVFTWLYYLIRTLDAPFFFSPFHVSSFLLTVLQRCAIRHDLHYATQVHSHCVYNLPLYDESPV